MGNVTAEPSMEDILSSIKRIIAEEGDTGPARPRRQARALPSTVASLDDDDTGIDDEGVLELNDPMPFLSPSPSSLPLSSSRVDEPAPPAPSPMPTGPIVSPQTAAAARGSLEALSRLMVKPEPSSDGTLEGLVREMLRPMLREWLDTNLPGMVEVMVAQEIAKITDRLD